MATLVGLWGHTARAAYSGAAVLDMIEAFRPDVVLMDIAMPGMDGFQLARQLRQEPCCREMLLIALTGYGDEAHRLRWEGAFDHYLVKPVELSILENLFMREQVRLAELPAVSGRTPSHGILVVDDEAGVLRVLDLVLRQQGFAVWPAAGGVEAVELYRRHREAIDVVLLDVCMPGLDGPANPGGAPGG